MLPLLAAVALALITWAFWHGYFGGFRLDLGSVDLPTRRFYVLAGLLALLGVPAVGGVVLAGVRGVSAERLASWREAWKAYPDSRTVLVAALLGTLIPLAIQAGVLGYAPLTDDEASYRFAAELLASFRLWAPSPSPKLFFDNAFLINDGKMYSQYFLGWPFLLAVGVKLGVPYLVNPVLSGATAVAMFQLAKGWWGSAWGRVAVVLYLASPLLMAGAATMMSHTTVLFALSWMLYFIQRVEAGGGARASAGMAFFLCLAFWARPVTTLGIATPLVLLWGLRVLRQEGRARLGHVAALLAVAVPLGALFLAANQAMNGSPFATGYHSAVRYAKENGHRFISFAPDSVETGGFWFFFKDTAPTIIVARWVTALFRLNVDAFGWPLGLGLALLARGGPARWLVAAAAGLCLAHIPLGDAGIDTFGPVHYSELMLPLVLLSVQGLRTLWRWTHETRLRAMVPAGLCGLFWVCATMYLPPRWNTLHLLASDIQRPRDFVAEQAPENSLVFVTPGFAPVCAGRPSGHFVFFRPNNSPDLDDAVLWVNHISVERDRELVGRMPGRKGFVLGVSRDCDYRLVPLEEATAKLFPPSVQELPTDFPPAGSGAR